MNEKEKSIPGLTSREVAQLETTERVRALTAELHSAREYTDPECDYFELVEDILLQIRADGAPGYPVVEWMKKHYGVEKDNYGQTVIYLGDGEAEEEA